MSDKSWQEAGAEFMAEHPKAFECDMRIGTNLTSGAAIFKNRKTGKIFEVIPPRPKIQYGSPEYAAAKEKALAALGRDLVALVVKCPELM
jgi:hypothetical protein